MRTDRRRAERRGRISEWTAAIYLVAKGYRILGWRVKTPLGEIDLVVARGRATAFVEVKSRRTVADAAAAVSRRKAERMIGAARCWIGGRGVTLDRDYRFDIVIVSAYHWPRHVPNAFGQELW